MNRLGASESRGSRTTIGCQWRHKNGVFEFRSAAAVVEYDGFEAATVAGKVMG
jgi:hypothetical protein